MSGKNGRSESDRYFEIGIDCPDCGGQNNINNGVYVDQLEDKLIFKTICECGREYYFQLAIGQILLNFLGGLADDNNTL